MISEFINLIQKDLNLFIKNKKGIVNDLVLFTNLNNVLLDSSTVDNKIIISLVNIDEEKLLQNPDNYAASRTEISYKNPAVWINIICLFTYYSKDHETYEDIDLLENVIQYFQSRPRLDKTTVINPDNFPNNIENLRAEFVSLNFEQTNYLWELFGGNYHPSVLYKFRALPIDNLDESSGGPPITDTKVNSKQK
ncbi:MAG TPA: DUF4255 domain-containing protein [Edaphocola sp.]|nr:DUF4255 domain-containing protein [Edaphocola sp.]